MGPGTVSPTVTGPPLNNRARLARDVARIYAPVAATDGPGGTVAVLAGDRVVHRSSYGLANVEFAQRWSARTLYPIASITKTMVADAALRLVEAGQLSLDATVDELVPGFALGEVQLAHLLTMTSGLGDDETAATLLGAEDGSNAYLLSLTRQAVVPRGRAGAFQSYACANYRLATLVLEHATGQPLEALLARLIFEPLGMHDTRVLRDWSVVPPRRASAYRPADGGFARAQETGESMGDGAVFTTLRDLVTYLRDLRQPTSDGPSRWHRLATTPVPLTSFQPVYGYGVMLDEHRGLACWGHGGSSNTRVIYVPAVDLTVACFNNHQGFNAQTDAVWQVLDAALDTLGVPAAAAATLPVAPGVYGEAESGVLFEIEPGGTAGQLRVLGGQWAPLRLLEGGGVEAAGGASVFRAWPAADGNLLFEERFAGRRVARRLRPSANNSTDEPLQGVYLHPVTGGTVTVERAGGPMALRLGHGERSDKRRRLVALGNGLFSADGITVRCVGSATGERQLELNHQRARGLRLVRVAGEPGYQDY